MVAAGRCGADGLVDDPVQLLEHLGHVGRVAPLLQLLVDGLDVVVALGIGQRARLHQQRLEADEHLPRHDLEAALGLVRGVERVHRVAQGFDAVKPGRTVKPGRVEAESEQVLLRRFDGLEQRRNQFLDRRHDATGTAAVVLVAQGVLRQRLAQALEHAVVVHDDAAVLAGEHAVGAGDGLHQVVRLHRLVDVERRQALDVEAGQPHRADDRDAEGMLRVLEGVLDRHPLAVGRLEAGLHHHPVRDDVEAPLLEVADLVLRFADDDLDDRALHPLRLTAQRIELRRRGAPARPGRWRRQAPPPCRGSAPEAGRAWPSSAARCAGTSARR